MNAEGIVRLVTDALDGLLVPYVLVGSFASNIYGIARSTQDVDLVIDSNLKRVSDLMRLLGPEFHRDPQIHFETVTGSSKSVIEHQPTKFEIEVFQLTDDPHDQSRFKRRRKARIYGSEMYVLTAEDVLVTKLNWLHRANRTKDLLDVQHVISVQDEHLDWPYIESWCNQHGSRALLEKIRSDLAQP